jgi:hypothetical protein
MLLSFFHNQKLCKQENLQSFGGNFSLPLSHLELANPTKNLAALLTLLILLSSSVWLSSRESIAPLSVSKTQWQKHYTRLHSERPFLQSLEFSTL